MPKQFYTDLALNGARISGMADGVSPADAVTYSQLQAYTAGLAWKSSVRVGTTSNISLTAPGASIDGITLVSGDRVLVKNQTDATQNGLYVWTGASAALTRATDANTGAKLAQAAVFVQEGSVNQDRAYVVSTDGAITVGTTALTWAQFGGLGLYQQGNGVDITGSVVSAKVAPGGGLVNTSAGLGIDTSSTARKVAFTVSGATSITVTHGLSTTDVVVQVRDASTNEVIETGVTITSANVVTLSLVAFPASLRVIVVG